MNEQKFYYIVGVALVVLLVLVVYVGSRVQNVELGILDLDDRLLAIETVLGAGGETGYYEGDYDYADQGASVYDTFGGDDYGYDYGYDSEQYPEYEYAPDYGYGY